MNEEVGIVTNSNNYLIYLEGLPSSRVNDMIENEDGVRGWISDVYPDRVEAYLLDDAQIIPGQLFKKSNKPLSIPISNELLGRAINPLSVPIDGKGPVNFKNGGQHPLETPTPGINKRQIISAQFETGILITDTLIPIGRGQRELVLGDARSGKTSFLTTTIINQLGKDIVCIVASIGKPVADIRQLIDTLDVNKALPYTIIIGASSTDPPPLIFLTPKTAFAIAEYFQAQGKDVLVILDDLGNHAKVYREMALLAGRIPGRESYPGDIFYQHAHLMEKAGNFDKGAGGGSITALPVIEISLNDFTTLIPTNLMAMTDGHLLFKSNLLGSGQNPAIDISLSVSRVGLQTQNPTQKLLSSKIKSVLTQADQLKTLRSFSTELSKEAQIIQKQAQIINELIKQESLTKIPIPIQICLLALTFNNFLIGKDLSFLQKNKNLIIQALSSNPQLINYVNLIYNARTEAEATQNVNAMAAVLETTTSL